MPGRGFARSAATAVAMIVLAALGASSATAASPSHATLTLGSDGKGKVAWTGTVGSTATSLGSDTDACFGADRKPDTTSGCDFFVFNVDASPEIVRNFIGSLDVTASGFGSNDLDIGVYVHNPNDTVGYRIEDVDDPTAGGNGAGEAEKFPILNPSGAARSYYVAVVPYTAPPGTTYVGAATFNLKRLNPGLDVLNAR